MQTTTSNVLSDRMDAKHTCMYTRAPEGISNLSGVMWWTIHSKMISDKSIDNRCSSIRLTYYTALPTRSPTFFGFVHVHQDAHRLALHTELLDGTTRLANKQNIHIAPPKSIS
eukprot:1120810-Prorocentrum_minimum.AAC.1